MTAIPAWAAILEGPVIGVSDGDTITVLSGDKEPVHVRVMGIDAPEKKQAFGQQSKQAIAECAFGKNASVDWSKKDRYGRTVGKVTVDGIDCGLRQIELGLAWHYKAYEKEQEPDDRYKYAVSHEKAKSERRGLWSDANPVPPWEYRHGGSGH
jgi:endonuclease YncB( thermonuclease family)